MVIKASPRHKHSRKSTERKQQIVDAAIKLFLQKGVTGTSMRDLAAAVGMEAGSLYNHFGSKDEIIDQVVKRGSKSVENLRNYGESLGDVSLTETIRKSIVCWVKQAPEDRDRIILLNRESPSSNPVRQKEIMDEVRADVRDFNDFFGGILREGMRTGEFRVDDISLVSFNIWTLKIEWALRQWWLGGKYTIDEYAEKQAQLIIRQLMADTACQTTK